MFAPSEPRLSSDFERAPNFPPHLLSHSAGSRALLHNNVLPSLAQPQESDTRPFSIPLLLVFFSPYAEPFGREQTGGSCSNPSEVLSLHCVSCAPLWVCHGMEGLVSWCNGSTTGFGSVCQGSNPCETTTVEGVSTPSFLFRSYPSNRPSFSLDMRRSVGNICRYRKK